MIRILGNILLSIVVVFASHGIVVSKHYIDGQRYSAALFSTAESCCQENEICKSCHNEHEIIKITTSLFASGQKNIPPAGSKKAIEKNHFVIHLFKTCITLKNFNQPRISSFKIPIREWLQVYML
jgi:hypothetical protein